MYIYDIKTDFRYIYYIDCLYINALFVQAL